MRLNELVELLASRAGVKTDELLGQSLRDVFPQDYSSSARTQGTWYVMNPDPSDRMSMRPLEVQTKGDGAILTAFANAFNELYDGWLMTPLLIPRSVGFEPIVVAREFPIGSYERSDAPAEPGTFLTRRWEQLAAVAYPRVERDEGIGGYFGGMTVKDALSRAGMLADRANTYMLRCRASGAVVNRFGKVDVFPDRVCPGQIPGEE